MLFSNDEKRKLRKLKREQKRIGNKNRRRALKRALEGNPEEAQHDEYEFKYDSSTPWNGEAKDRKRMAYDE